MNDENVLLTDKLTMCNGGGDVWFKIYSFDCGFAFTVESADSSDDSLCFE
jgi:hypothetical protein